MVASSAPCVGSWSIVCLILHLIAACRASEASLKSPEPSPAETQATEAASILKLLAGEFDDGFAAAGGDEAAYPAQSVQQFASTGATGSRRGSSSNSTGSFRFSHQLQIKIPQPWDTINMSQIVRDNLEPDLQFWLVHPYEPTVADLFETARTDREFVVLPSVRQLVEIYNNKIRFPLMPPEQQYGCGLWCDPQLADFVMAMQDAVNVFNLTLPNVLFLINTADSPRCNQEMVANRECRSPVISLCKEPHIADLLGPVMKAADAQLQHRHLPWEQKVNKAFFRGVPSCGEMPFPPHCARSWVARLAQTNYSDWLDAGLVERYDRPDQIAGDPVLRDGHGLLPVLPRVHMAELPKYKWLLNLDGHVAAYRLAQLLATNSLVLKQQSVFHEYYYRSLRAYHHYVPIFKHSEHDLIPKLHWAVSHEEIVRRIVRNANSFALKYTSYHARILYWQYLLIGYSKLVPDMAEYFEKKDREPQPVDIVALLKQQWAAVQHAAKKTWQQQQQQQQEEPGGLQANGQQSNASAGTLVNGSDATSVSGSGTQRSSSNSSSGRTQGGGSSSSRLAGGDEPVSELAVLAGEDSSSDAAELEDQAEAEVLAKLAGTLR